MKEKDFARVTFKVNASGSWATLVGCSTDHYDKVKAACETIANASESRISFKVVDADGGTLEEYSPVQGQRCWHEPKRRA